MTDLFNQQGITFESSHMASTAPNAAVAPPKIPQVSVSELNKAQDTRGPIPPPPAPESVSTTAAPADTLAGNGGNSLVAAAPPVAPPGAQAAPRDLFAEQGIEPPSITDTNNNVFNSGVMVDPNSTPKSPGPPVGVPIGSNNMPGREQAAAYARQDQNQMLTLAQSRFTPEQITQWQNNPISFSEAFHMLHARQVLPGGGLVSLYDSLQLKGIAEKAQSGQSLSADDQQKLNTFLNEQIEMSVRKFTWGGNIAYIGSQIPAFIAEFALSDGVGKMAQTAAVKGAEEVGIHSAIAAATGAIARTAATTALMPAQYAAKYGERRVNDAMAVTDKGDLVLKDSEESPAKSALLAYGHTAADVAGQVAAPGIGKYIVDPATKAVSTPLVAAVNQLPAATRDALYQAYKAINPNAQVSKVFTAAGWAGMLEQLGANRVQQVLNSSIDYASDDKLTYDQYLDHLTPSKDQLMVEGGLIAIAGGIHTSASVAVNLMKSKGVPGPIAAETVDNMTALEKDNFVNSNLPTPKSDYPRFQDDGKAPQDQSSPATKEAIHYDETQNPSTGGQIIAGQVSALGSAQPPPVQASQSSFNAGWKEFKDTHLTSIYAELANDLQPIENLSKKAKAQGAVIPEGEDTQLLASFVKSTPEWIRRNQMVDTTTWDENGNQVITGKGLKPIYDDFDNTFLPDEPDMNVRHQDFDDYLIAKRLLEEKASDRDVLVTPEQEAKSLADLQRITDKYGENARFFETFANEVRDWDNRILHNLVTSGLKTQEWYDDTVSQRQHYSPLNRVVEEEIQPTISRAGIGKDVTPSRIGSLKQFKGSEKEIKNTFQSRLRNSALILQKSAVNKLRVNIAKYAQYYPDEVKISRPGIVREAVKHDYDPKLREKLEHLVDFLGGDIKRSQKIEGAKRGTLGAYDAKENLIHLRLGSTEGTMAHEAGHMLDEKLNLQKRLLGEDGVKAELQKLAEDRIGGTFELKKGADGKTQFEEEQNAAPATYRKYIKSNPEVIANFVDAYMNSPEQVEKTAPKAKAAFEKLIDENPQLAFIKEIKPSTNRATETIEKELLDMRGPKGSIPVYLKGRRNYMELSPELQKAFESMTPIQMGMVERFIGGIFRGSKKLLQFGATSTPDFMLRHFYRAVGTSFLNTKGGLTPIDFIKHATVDIPRGIFAVMGKNELYHEWASSSGALQTYMDLSDKGLAKMQKEMFSGNSLASFINPLNWLKMAKEVSDFAPRVATFKKMKAQGASDLAAGLASLEATGNYVRHGSLVKRINQYAPFFNDMVQGGDRFVRSIMRDPAAFTTRAIGTIMLPQLAMTGYYLYAADDQTREEYLNLPDWRRSISFNVKIGDTWVPIPRYFAPGFVFGAIPEKVMIWAYSGNHPETKNFWMKMLAETATSVSPVFDWTRAINPIMKSVLESITNYSFFMQRPLFSGDMQKTAPSSQFNQYTSETAKMLGKMFNFSPTDIDNTVYDMSAKIGKYGMQLSDMAINATRKATGQPVNERPERVTDNPLYGGLIEETPRGSGTEAFSEFREHVADATQAHNQFRESKGADQAQFHQENARTLSAYPAINAAQTQVNHLFHQIRLINQNTNLSGSDKTVQINHIQDQITRLVEGANLRYRAATKQGE